MKSAEQDKIKRKWIPATCFRRHKLRRNDSIKNLCLSCKLCGEKIVEIQKLLSLRQKRSR